MNKFLFTALLTLVASCIAQTTISIDLRYQEKNNWHWAAAAQSILERNGNYVSQTALANWATPGQYAAGLGLSGSSKTLDNVLLNFGNISTTYTASSLSWTALTGHINANRPVIIQLTSVWGARTVVIYGYGPNQTVYLLDPYPGEGRLTDTYSNLLVNQWDERWTRTLVVNTQPGTQPARPIPEASVPKNYAVYAFSQTGLNDGVKCYANTTTTTQYCEVASGWQKWAFANPNGTYGINLGVDAKVGTIRSSGPVWLRDRSKVYGNVYMINTAELVRQNQTTITGTIYQTAVPYQGFGWGRINWAGVAQNHINIEPDRGTTSIAPGKYWGYTVKARSTLRLRAGDYFFNRLECDGCKLELDETNGPIRVYVDGNVMWRGTQIHINGNATKFMLAYLGTNSLFIDSQMKGTVIAPQAEMIVGQSYKTHEGMFIGKKVWVHQYTTLRFNPFSFQ